MWTIERLNRGLLSGRLRFLLGGGWQINDVSLSFDSRRGRGIDDLGEDVQHLKDLVRRAPYCLNCLIVLVIET